MQSINDIEVRESARQFILRGKVTAAVINGADLADRPGISVFWADCSYESCNSVFLDECHAKPTLLHERLREAA